MASGFTRDFIISRALEIVGNSSLTTVAQNVLNVILHRLYTEFSWDFLLKSTTLNFAAGAKSPTGGLPADYYKQHSLKFLDTSGANTHEYIVSWIPFSEYVLIREPTQTDKYPQVFTVNPTFGEGASQQANLLVYPAVSGASTFTLYYFYLPDTLGSDVAPVFPDHAYLIDALVNELKLYLRHPNYDPSFQERHIGRVRAYITDQGINSAQLSLDPRVFRSPASGMSSRRWPRDSGS